MLGGDHHRGTERVSLIEAADFIVLTTVKTIALQAMSVDQVLHAPVQIRKLHNNLRCDASFNA